jgi:hypothetical protein
MRKINFRSIFYDALRMVIYAIILILLKSYFSGG